MLHFCRNGREKPSFLLVKRRHTLKAKYNLQNKPFHFIATIKTANLMQHQEIPSKRFQSYGITREGKYALRRLTVCFFCYANAYIFIFSRVEQQDGFLFPTQRIQNMRHGNFHFILPSHSIHAE